MTSPPIPRSATAILWLGDGRLAEFAPTFDALAARASMTACVGPSDAELPATDLAPALVVVAQGFAGEFADADVVRLRRRYPTAALVRLAGSWCEGELRTAPPIPGAKRILAHQALPLLLADLARLERGLLPDWGLPATATEEETLLSAFDAPPQFCRGEVCIGIAASEPLVERWLVDLCVRCTDLPPAVVSFGAHGFAPGGESRTPAPDVILWDVPASRMIAEAELARLTERFAGTKIIALASFPRRDELECWRERGVVVVVGKPISPTALPACIELLALKNGSRHAGENSN